MMAEALDNTSVIDDVIARTPSSAQQAPEPASDDLYIAQAGEGVDVAVNPLQGFIRNRQLPEISEEDYAGATQPRSASAGGASTDVQSRLVAEAKKWVGTPYVWGASRPGAFDCSGFVQYVYKQMGVELPRVSYQQMAAGRSVDKGDLQVGDLLGWDYSGRNPGADHIAIYIGNGQIAHTNTPGKPMRIESLASKPQNYTASRVL